MGPGVGGLVSYITTAYDTGGRPYLYTSWNYVRGYPAVFNQVEDLYNGLGQLITEYQAVSGPVNTSTTPSVQYAYSFVTTSGGPNHSRLVSMTYPNGRVLNYNYNSGVDDRISRLSSISDSSGTLEAYSYLDLNTVVTRSHPQTGINQTYVIPGGNTDGGDQYTGLDRFGRVVEEKWLNPNTGTVADDFLYTYDRDGNRLTSSNALDSALSQQFTYDNLNQLATFTQGSHTESWSLDAVGNWLSFTDDGSTQTRSFNSQNQLTSISGATTPTYDANGNTLTDDNGTQYIYDAWNRIIEAVAGSQTMSYSYDALGRRIIIQSNSNPANDEYFSSNWQVIEEDQQGTMQRQWVWSNVYVDGLIEQDSGSSRWYAQQDANWNVTAMVASTGSVANRFVYDPYGKGTMYDANWNLQGALSTTWVYYFQGGRFDSISGLYNFRNRDLSPMLGRWMQEDPIPYSAGDINLYRYLAAKPIIFNDPMGLIGICLSDPHSVSPDEAARQCLHQFYTEVARIIRGRNACLRSAGDNPGKILVCWLRFYKNLEDARERYQECLQGPQNAPRPLPVPVTVPSPVPVPIPPLVPVVPIRPVPAVPRTPVPIPRPGFSVPGFPGFLIIPDYLLWPYTHPYEAPIG